MNDATTQPGADEMTTATPTATEIETCECQRCERELPEHLVAYDSMCWPCCQKFAAVEEAENATADATEEVERLKAELAEAVAALKAARRQERKVVRKYGPNR